MEMYEERAIVLLFIWSDIHLNSTVANGPRGWGKRAPTLDIISDAQLTTYMTQAEEVTRVLSLSV